jgi:hypothetical protein
MLCFKRIKHLRIMTIMCSRIKTAPVAARERKKEKESKKGTAIITSR